MGGEQGWAGKYVRICVALLTLLSACASIREAREREEVRNHLWQAHALLTQGDYEGALKQNEKILASLGSRSPGDEALFNMGLIYVHYANPKKDYRKATGFFRRLMKEYPQSSLVEQARIWVGVLDEIDQLRRVDIEIEQKKRGRER